MRTLDPSVGLASELDPVSRVVLEFEAAWRSDVPPPIDRFRDRFGPDEVRCGLAELVRADLQNRYRRGDRPAAREYLDRFPELAEEGRALSLIYEEYCLRAEAEGPLDASDFCRAYPTWRDSLASQLAYHRDLSRAVEPIDEAPEFPGPGDRFAEYELVDILGRGGSARVFLAHSTHLGGRPVALKVGPNRGGEPKILGKLDHANIVPVQAMVVDPATGLRGLCMPYRPGLALDELIRRFRREGPPARARAVRALVDPDGAEANAPGWADFPEAGTYPDAVAWVGLKVARALAYAHSRGFFHRDVKPENVLLNGRDGPQLIDFNLAHDPDSADRAHAAQRGGTLPYMAREQLEAFLDPAKWGRVDGRADLFSLGLVLRELLTLEAPPRPSVHLDLPRAVNAMIRAREAPRPPIRRANRGVPHALAAIVAKCLAPSAADRYAEAADLATDLTLYLSRRPLLYAKNPSRVEPVLNGLRRHRVAVAVAVAVLATGAALLILANRSRGGLDQAPTQEGLLALERAVADEAAGRQAEASARIAGAANRADAIRSFLEAVRQPPRVARPQDRPRQGLREGRLPRRRRADLSPGPGPRPRPDRRVRRTGQRRAPPRESRRRGRVLRPVHRDRRAVADLGVPRQPAEVSPQPRLRVDRPGRQGLRQGAFRRSPGPLPATPSATLGAGSSRASATRRRALAIRSFAYDLEFARLGRRDGSKGLGRSEFRFRLQQ